MMQERVSNMKEHDKLASMKYITNLIKLSKLYWSSGEQHVFYG